MPVAVVSIPVSDPEASLAYYRDVLALSVVNDTPMGPAMRWLQMQPADGGSTVALVTWFDQMKPGSMQGLMFHVADIDAEHARIAAAGGTPSPIDEQPWGRFTMLSDPDGNGLIVAQLTAPEDVKTR
ncbi:VOC family protein [Sphingomonas bacterium]|uniref:VOC family protein n=1 Tax=Sphingomonas bacterium TaxID=1895847 RepID=UPI0015767051|nr:VOC family protein [Sphingomonas bacterium]